VSPDVRARLRAAERLANGPGVSTGPGASPDVRARLRAAERLANGPGVSIGSGARGV